MDHKFQELHIDFDAKIPLKDQLRSAVLLVWVCSQVTNEFSSGKQEKIKQGYYLIYTNGHGCWFEARRHCYSPN